jgi:uncharacterized protein YqeY
MTLTQQIQADFITALKGKNTQTKDALALIKAALLNEQKKSNNQELDDAQALNVLVKMVKQRKDSITEFTKGNRLDLVAKEQGELDVISQYLPKQLSLDEIKTNLTAMLGPEGLATLKTKQGIGKARGAFGKQFNGQFEVDDLVQALNDLANEQTA